ncbi:MAG: polyribonucleotide nucleotidyltransferase [bacterium]
MDSTQLYEAKCMVGTTELSVSVGKLAKQAGGAVLVRYGDSVVLATATRSKEIRDIGYFPLTVDFEEKMYAAGKIPGGFIKREGRASDHAVLSARIVDRSIRPMFPKGYKNEVQVICLALSSDMENPFDILGLVGASAALGISDIPFDGPVAAVRIGRLEGKFIVNPTFSQLEKCDIDIIVAGTGESINMVEGEASEVDESVFVEALETAREPLKALVEMQKEMIAKIGKTKSTFEVREIDAELVKQVTEFAEPLISALENMKKVEREEGIEAIKKEAIEKFAVKDDVTDAVIVKDVKDILEEVEGKIVRGMICGKGIRPDGRKMDEIRQISCEVSLLPRTHGSGLFTRGQTQALSILTLGTIRDAQRIDGISKSGNKPYMHQYNFPPFSVGETKFMRGPSRRDIGHGMLAERALARMIPAEEDFPYAIRVVSEVLESNGSSSMASVCGSTLALLDAGVPIKSPIAGIAMGLVVEENGKAHILTDIQGVEDHLGDMDFKVAGSTKGITAVQMDIKVKGITSEVMAEAMQKARAARLSILEKMMAVIDKPRADMSPYAPRFYIIRVEVDKIGTVIGPGGKTIRRIIEETGTEIDIEDDGRVYIYAVDKEAGERAKAMVEGLVEEVEVGRIYTGTVRRIMNFGAFVEVLPNVEGLVHISQLKNERVNKVEDVVNVGDTVKVRVREIDDQGRVNLTMKGLDA